MLAVSANSEYQTNGDEISKATIADVARPLARRLSYHHVEDHAEWLIH